MKSVSSDDLDEWGIVDPSYATARKPQRSILWINRPKAMPADQLLIKPFAVIHFRGIAVMRRVSPECYTGSEPQHAFVYRHRCLMLLGLCISLHKSIRNLQDFHVTEEQKSVDWLSLRNYLVLFSFQAYQRQTLQRCFCFRQQKSVRTEDGRSSKSTP